MNLLLFYLSKINKKKAERLYRFWLKFFNKNKNFTIISNNCFGGGIYESLNLPYLTPTVGLFFYAPDYILFLKNLKQNLYTDIEFRNKSKYEEANVFRETKKWFYPIGFLDNGIEIHFMHYKTNKEALTKWKRRAERVKFDNLYIKFCDRDLCTDELAIEFDKLNFKNKVFFSSKKKDLNSLVYLPYYENKECIGDLYNAPWTYRKEINILKWIKKYE